MPLGIAFLIFVARNPDISKKLGLVGAKANLMSYSATDWPAYLGLSGMIIAAAGFFLFVLIISWVFGREFTDRTVKDVLAVPVARSSIVLAKFIVVAAWSAVLAIVIFIASLATGALIQLPGGSFSVILHGSAIVLIGAALAIVVVLPFGLLASMGRGYMLPIGVAFLVLIMTNVVALVGWGDYFPWAVPGLYAQGKGALAPISYWLVLLTGLAGMIGTYLWWMHADQSK